MAIYTYECPDCQGEVMVGFSDRVLDTELIWSASHKCDRCYYRVEDGFGRLPAQLVTRLRRILGHLFPNRYWQQHNCLKTNSSGT